MRTRIIPRVEASPSYPLEVYAAGASDARTVLDYSVRQWKKRWYENNLFCGILAGLELDSHLQNENPRFLNFASAWSVIAVYALFEVVNRYLGARIDARTRHRGRWQRIIQCAVRQNKRRKSRTSEMHQTKKGQPVLFSA